MPPVECRQDQFFHSAMSASGTAISSFRYNMAGNGEDENDDVNLYDDLLIDEEENRIQEQVKKAQQYVELERQCETQKTRIHDLETEITTVKKENSILRRNISVLYKTAKLEIERKDALLTDLQQRYDNVVFRRTKGGGMPPRQTPRDVTEASQATHCGSDAAGTALTTVVQKQLDHSLADDTHKAKRFKASSDHALTVSGNLKVPAVNVDFKAKQKYGNMAAVGSVGRVVRSSHDGDRILSYLTSEKKLTKTCSAKRQRERSVPEKLEGSNIRTVGERRNPSEKCDMLTKSRSDRSCPAAVDLKSKPVEVERLECFQRVTESFKDGSVNRVMSRKRDEQSGTSFVRCRGHRSIDRDKRGARSAHSKLPAPMSADRNSRELQTHSSRALCLVETNDAVCAMFLPPTDTDVQPALCGTASLDKEETAARTESPCDLGRKIGEAFSFAEEALQNNNCPTASERLSSTAGSCSRSEPDGAAKLQKTAFTKDLERNVTSREHESTARTRRNSVETFSRIRTCDGTERNVSRSQESVSRSRVREKVSARESSKQLCYPIIVAQNNGSCGVVVSRDKLPKSTSHRSHSKDNYAGERLTHHRSASSDGKSSVHADQLSARRGGRDSKVAHRELDDGKHRKRTSSRRSSDDAGRGIERTPRRDHESVVRSNETVVKQSSKCEKSQERERDHKVKKSSDNICANSATVRHNSKLDADRKINHSSVDVNSGSVGMVRIHETDQHADRNSKRVISKDSVLLTKKNYIAVASLNRQQAIRLKGDAAKSVRETVCNGIRTGDSDVEKLDSDRSVKCAGNPASVKRNVENGMSVCFSAIGTDLELEDGEIQSD